MRLFTLPARSPFDSLPTVGAGREPKTQSHRRTDSRQGRLRRWIPGTRVPTPSSRDPTAGHTSNGHRNKPRTLGFGSHAAPQGRRSSLARISRGAYCPQNPWKSSGKGFRVVVAHRAAAGSPPGHSDRGRKTSRENRRVKDGPALSITGRGRARPIPLRFWAPTQQAWMRRPWARWCEWPRMRITKTMSRRPGKPAGPEFGSTRDSGGEPWIQPRVGPTAPVENHRHARSRSRLVPATPAPYAPGLAELNRSFEVGVEIPATLLCRHWFSSALVAAWRTACAFELVKMRI